MAAHAFRFLTLAGALLLLGSAVQAQAGPGHHTRGQRLMGLRLSGAQQTRVKALRERHEAALQAKAGTLAEAREALRAAMVQPDEPVASLKALHDRLAAAQFDLLLERRSLHQELLPLLTPEQRARLEKRRSERSQGVRRNHGHGSGNGPNQGLAPSSAESRPS